VINGSGRTVRSAVEMSEHAVYGDGFMSSDPNVQSSSVETLTNEQKSFREAWLGSKAKQPGTT
jgi:hypothetical protein